MKNSGNESKTHSPPIFRAYDHQIKTEVSQRCLPHWQQEGCTYFVTWRMADSMPLTKYRQWRDEREQWLKCHPKPWDSKTQIEHTELFEAKIQRWLDLGYGSCALKDPSLREIVISSFLHYQDQHYRLHDFVIMPNHVHVLFTPYPNHSLSTIITAWKRFTSHMILKQTGGQAPFWLPEWFDHIVRSTAQMNFYQQYIRENPHKAHLKENEWSHWSSGE
jgi:type I restriction enzyme, R subunit